MIDNISNNEEKKFYSIKNIKLFEYKSLTIPILNYLVDPNSDIILNKHNFALQVDNYLEYNKVLAPIYGYNFIKNNLCEQVLLSTEIITLNMKNQVFH